MKSCCFILFMIIGCSAARSQQTTDTLLIHFDYNQSSITAQAAATLDSFLQAATPTAAITQIILSGHCDFIGSHIYNDSLSQQRVRATKEYLGDKGFSPTLFSNETGFGKRRPLTPDITDAARAVNRRVEIIFTRQAIVQAVPPKKETEIEVTTTSKPTLSQIIGDTATKTGSTLVLPNMNFEPGRHFLLSGSYGILRELYRVMKDNPTLQIEIHGHICCLSGGVDGPDIDTGSPNLSVERAKAIYNYLVSAGIAANRMQYKGFGSSQKLYPEERSPMEMSKNRRVEIKIISK